MADDDMFVSIEDEYSPSDLIDQFESAIQGHLFIPDFKLKHYKEETQKHMDSLQTIMTQIGKVEVMNQKRKEEEERKRKEEEEQKRKEEEEKKKRGRKRATPVPTHQPVVTTVSSAVPATVVTMDMSTLISQLTNPKQIDILERVRRRGLDDQMYFVNFERNSRQDNARYRAMMGTFTIMGTMNKKGVRESYSVDLYNPDVYDSSKKIFNCDCPAHRFKSSSDNTVCKHISFIMCRVIGHITKEFFTTHRLSREEVNMIMEKMSVQREEILVHIEQNRMNDTTQQLKTEGRYILQHDSFLNSTRDVSEEDCPICFDVVEAGNENRLNCPDCKKHVHKECMEIWLSRNDSCVYCRSSVWKHYTKCFLLNQTVELKK